MMGTNLLAYYQNNIKRTWKLAFFSTVCVFLLVHLFKIANTLPNHDSYYNVYFNQDMTISGRWFLQYACGLSSYFDLTWVIGVMCALWLGVTSVCITELFDLKNPVVIVLSGAVLAACPSTTETLFFGFTADGYLLGLALAALSACLSCKSAKWQHNVLAGLCLCLCCAIYQSCVSFAVVLCICWLVKELLEDRMSVRAAWCWIGRHVLLYGAALGAYYLLWKLLMAVKGVQAVDYQGIDQIGTIQVSTLISGAVASVTNLFFLFLEWNILEHPISLYGALNILFLVSFAIVLAAALIRSGVCRKPGKLVLILIALAASVPMISVWRLLSEGVQYRPMMLHSAVIYYIFAMILFDRWVDARKSTLFGLLMCLAVGNFAVMANIGYFHMEKCWQRTYYEGIRMMETIDEARDEYGEQIEAIAFTGSRMQDVIIPEIYQGQQNHIFTNLLEESLLFDHAHIYPYLSDTFGLELYQTPGAVRTMLEEQTRSMPAWPEDGCYTVIDNVLVINLEEQS